MVTSIHSIPENDKRQLKKTLKQSGTKQKIQDLWERNQVNKQTSLRKKKRCSKEKNDRYIMEKYNIDDVIEEHAQPARNVEYGLNPDKKVSHWRTCLIRKYILLLVVNDEV